MTAGTAVCHKSLRASLRCIISVQDIKNEKFTILGAVSVQLLFDCMKKSECSLTVHLYHEIK